MTDNNYKAVSVLLVEDDEVDAMGIKRAFNKLRVANPIFHARDGVEGLQMLRDGTVTNPCMILLDLNMPRMNGLEMLKEIRNDPALADSVIFVLTTSKNDEDKAAAYRKNIAGYIVKSSLDKGFDDFMQLLDHYWRLVEFPASKS